MCPPQQQWEPTGGKHTNPGTHVCHLRVRTKHVFVSTGFSWLAPVQISETLPERCFQPPSPMIPKPKKLYPTSYVCIPKKKTKTYPTNNTLTGSTTTRGSGEHEKSEMYQVPQEEAQRQQEQNRNNDNNNNNNNK